MTVPGRDPPPWRLRHAEDHRERPATHWPASPASCRSTVTAASNSPATDQRPGALGVLLVALRRYFYDCHQTTASPIAFGPCGNRPALRRRGAIRGRTAEARLAARREHSRPIVDALKTWLLAQLERISGKSSLAEAIRYALRHWNGLGLFLDDGRVELDTNVVERSIRPIALGRKNSLFAGSDGGARHWAIAASLINTAKLHAVEPFAYLKDVLERIVTGRTKAHQLDELLPWQWKATSTVNP
jgi:hypothetical protein